MRVRILGTALAVGALLAGCSDDSSDKSSSASSTTVTARSPAPPPSFAPLPAGIARSEQFCSLTSALAEKFRGAKRPSNPEESAPYIRDVADFLRQAVPVAPKELTADVQKLSQFYSQLGDRLASGTPPSTPFALDDLAGSSSRMRQYFKTVCGVDDEVFNL